MSWFAVFAIPAVVTLAAKESVAEAIAPPPFWFGLPCIVVIAIVRGGGGDGGVDLVLDGRKIGCRRSGLRGCCDCCCECSWRGDDGLFGGCAERQCFQSVR